MTLKACLLLFLAGGCGTLSRFLVSTGVNALAGRNLPFGTIRMRKNGSAGDPLRCYASPSGM